MQILSNSKEDLKYFLKSLPKDCGVYSFIGENKIPIYIGKAKNLKNRVSSYFQNSNKSTKVKSLINEAKYLDVTITNSELEALLLEQHLIKEIKPKFNVQFKDDKGYPWIKIETSKDFPSAKSFLGKKNNKDVFFGPYPNSYAVREALSLIQKTFQLRNCSDSFFKNRSRPCLQHQIGRCSAPCVGLIKQDEYLKTVKSTTMLLQGKAEELIAEFYSHMDTYSKKQSYEIAASYRDKISALRDVQRNQSISGFIKERDALSINTLRGITKIGVTHVKGGWITGHENFVQENNGLEKSIMETFIKSHYLSSIDCPQNLVIDTLISDKKAIENALSLKHSKSIKIITKPGKRDKGLLAITKSNTKFSSQRAVKGSSDITSVLSLLKKQFDFKNDIKLIESYDISHHSGSGAVGGCVVYSKEGKLKNDYRTYNISKTNAGNDIGSMVELIERRFHIDKATNIPDLILIDGGKTHLDHVVKKLILLNKPHIEVMAISKGSRRKAIFDSLHLPGQDSKLIKRDSPSHNLIQEIRDETHRFAINSHKRKRAKISIKSSIDSLSGVGPERKKLLLRYFGSFKQIKRANIDDLSKVSGIGEHLASSIFKEIQDK